MSGNHKVDHLILLVGSNPVPNAVAGKLLVKTSGTITLISSDDSLSVAQRLKTWLSQDRSVQIREPNDSRVDPAEPHSIFTGVCKALCRVNAQSVGLNYTGGTKAMSVHAYRVVEQWCKDKNIQSKFSYLDARTLSMVFDSQDPQSGQHSQKIPVATEVSLSLQGLLQLHGWSLNTEPVTSPQLPRSALALLNAHTNNKASISWFKWIASLEEHARKANKWQNEELRDKPLSWIELHEHDALKNFIEEFSEESGTNQGSHLDFAALKDNGTFAKIKHVPEWLHGKWLEHALLQLLQDQQDELKLHDCVHNVVPQEVEFDVDVVAMRGYQLFAFSCSTSTEKSLLKQKLFEAATRARQLGGDEACAALVCLYDDSSKLQKEVRDIFGESSESERIKVFGREHLANFSNELAYWIKRQSNMQ